MPPSSRIRGDGVELALRTWGDPADPAVVLVHGFPDTHAVWIPVAERLAGRGFHVAAADVRGAGDSEAPAALEAYGLDHLVADLAAVVDAVSPERPVHLVGHDWGSIQGWEALLDPRLEGRIASFTSISGLPLDHASRWLRGSARHGHVLRLLRQAGRSSYVAVFHVPGLAGLARRSAPAISATRARWAATLRRVEGAATDEAWPAPTFGRDVGRGMDLYKANFRRKLRRATPRQPTPVPVQLIIPVRDRFVPEWLFEGLEDLAPDLRRVQLDARHWVIRSDPAEVARLVAEHAAASSDRRSA